MMFETLTAAVVGVVFVIAVWVGRVWNRARKLPPGIDGWADDWMSEETRIAIDEYNEAKKQLDEKLGEK